MKPLYLLLLSTILFFSCIKENTKETSLLDFVPNNPSVILHTPSINQLQEELKGNLFLKEFENTITYKEIKSDFQFITDLKSENSMILSYAKVGKSLEYLLSLNTKNTDNKIPLNPEKTTYNNKEYQQLKNQKAYSIVLDSTLIITSSEILMENLIRNNNANIRYSNKSLLKLYDTADESKITTFINLEKKPLFLNSIFPTVFLTKSDWIAAELNGNDGISINGLATNTKILHKLASKLATTSPEKSNASNVIPSNFSEYTSYNFNEIKLNSEFDNFNELVDNSTEIVSFKDNRSTLCAFKLLNMDISENLTEHSTYRNQIIFKNDYFKIPATICNPQPSFVSYLEDFIVFSESEESLQNCISHVQNKTALINQNYYTESSEALLSEAHIVKSIKTDNLKNNLATVLDDESIRKVKLNDFPLVMHQITYEDTYIQLNSILKKITKKNTTTSVSQIASITLDADLANDIQWVTNHKTRQKEILVQDANNQLYLISNKGTILWKKKLNGKIKGQVIQVDLFKNKKLQLAFTTENEFMVLDRNGTLVDQFHKTFNNGNLLPLAVFDYDNNRNYRFVITQNNKVSMYDNSFKPVKGFEFNVAKSDVIQSPKHVRIGTKDYIVINESNGQLHILNRQGKSRTTIKTTFDFDKRNLINIQKNSVDFQDAKNVIMNVNVATGKISKSDILQGNTNYYNANSNLIVKLEDEKLTIKNKTLELDLGNYTAPEVVYLNKKYYISSTDIDTRKVYLFDTNAKPLDKFPVYGQSKIALTNMDADKQLEFAVKGESNSILIYKM